MKLTNIVMFAAVVTTSLIAGRAGAQEIFRRQRPTYARQAPYDARIAEHWGRRQVARRYADAIGRTPPLVSAPGLPTSDDFQRLVEAWNTYQRELLRYQSLRANPQVSSFNSRPLYPERRCRDADNSFRPGLEPADIAPELRPYAGNGTTAIRPRPVVVPRYDLYDQASSVHDRGASVSRQPVRSLLASLLP